MARDEAYQEAEQRIEAARQEEDTELNLSNMGLTELPEAITSLTQLQNLDLFSNQSTELPEAIAVLSSPMAVLSSAAKTQLMTDL